MQLLNRYFTPFAAFLILTAIFFSEPGRKTTTYASLIWLVSLIVNAWFSANTYRFIGWSQYLRAFQVGMNFIWAVPLVYLLGATWAPMWLLFAMAPATAALTMGFRSTLGVGCLSAGTLLGLYALRGVQGTAAWGMAFVHAAFLILLSLFVHALAQTALRLRDFPDS